MKTVSHLMGKAMAPLAIVAIAVALPVAVGGSGPVWQQLASSPSPRQEVTYVALGGQTYLAAGDDRSQHRYDPGTDQWSSVASLPPSFESADHVNGIAVGGRIAYIGGLTQWEDPFPVIDAVALYDPGTNSFSDGAEMSAPRAAGGVALWQGKVIYAGGLGPDGSVARVDAYDPVSDEWIQLADMPRPRDHFQLAIVDGRLYAIGGRETTVEEGDIEIAEIAAVDVLDLPTSDSALPTAAWQPGATSLPTPRGGLGVAVVGECIYAIGGESDAGGSSGVTGATESYEPSTGTWRELPPLWTPRHGVQAAVVDEAIYVAAGGTTAFDYNPTAAHETLDVSGDEPCLAAVDTETPDGGSADASDHTPPSAGAAGGVHIVRLAVRPQRVLLRSGPPRRRGARIVLALSHAARVVLRLPGRFQLDRQLRAGRNVIPLPRRSRGRLLPRGRYQLVAEPRPPGAGGEPVSVPFRVVD